MPITPDEALKDPEFLGLPLGEQFKAMRNIDPEFRNLPLKQQGTVLSKAKQKSLGLDRIGEKQQDPGFFSTLGHDIADIPAALMATGTGEPGDERRPGIISALGAAQHAEFEKGRTAPTALERAGHTLAGAIPVIGPMAASIGESIGEGRYGEAAARGTELAAGEALSRVPAGKIGRALKTTIGKTGETAKAGLKAAQSVKVPFTVRALLHTVPGGSAALRLIDAGLKADEVELAYGMFKDRYGNEPAANAEKAKALGEWAGQKAAARKTELEKSFPKALKALKKPTLKEAADAKEAAKAEEIRKSAEAYRKESGPPKRFSAEAAGVKPANIPEGPKTPSAAPQPHVRSTKEKIEAGRAKAAAPAAPARGKPVVRLKARTGPATEHAQSVSTERSEQDIGRFASNFARDRNAQIGNILKSKGFTPEQVAGMSEDEFYRAVGSKDPATGKPIRKFQGKLDASGKAATQHRTFEQGRNDIVAWMTESDSR